MVTLPKTGQLIQIAQLGRFMFESLTSFARYYYTPTFLKIDEFQNYRKKFLTENCHQLLLKKIKIKESLKKPDAKVFTSDIKFLLYSAREQDIDFLINVIKKYNTQKNEDGFDFLFALPLLKLMYVLNQTDKALEIYLSEDNLFQFQYRVTVLLINKLLEEKRYNDVVRVYDHFNRNLKKQPPEKSNYFELYGLITEALYEKNDQEALKKYKEMLKDSNYSKTDINQSDYMKMCLLALQQKDPAFAYELTEKITKRPIHVVRNLQILALIELNRTDEALLIAEELKRMFGKPNNITLFETPMEKLLEATENRANENSRVRKLIEEATVDKNFSYYDLREFVKILNESREKDNNRGAQKSETNSDSNTSKGAYKKNRNNQREFRDGEFNQHHN